MDKLSMSLNKFLLGLFALVTTLAFAYYYGEFEGVQSGMRFSMAVGAGLGGVIGGLLLGLIIWIGIRIGSRKGNAPEPKIVLFATAFVVSALSFIPEFESQFFVTNDERQEFIVGMERGCFKAQRDYEGHTNISDETLQAYCKCISKHVTSQFTESDLRQIIEHEKLPAAWESMTQETALECRTQTVVGN